MKHLLFLPALFFLFSVPAGASLLSEAQRAFTTGDLVTAKQKFEQVLKTDPQNVTARNYLRMITATESKSSGQAKAMENQLKGLTLPTLNLNDATLDATLEYLRVQAEELSGGQVKTSFVLHPGVDGSKRVTLRLSHIPFTEALRYVGELAGVKFTVEAYAIAVRPANGPAAAPAPASETP